MHAMMASVGDADTSVWPPRRLQVNVESTTSSVGVLHSSAQRDLISAVWQPRYLQCRHPHVLSLVHFAELCTEGIVRHLLACDFCCQSSAATARGGVNVAGGQMRGLDRQVGSAQWSP